MCLEQKDYHLDRKNRVDSQK